MKKILKLYELPNNSKFRVAGIILKLHHLDGMYSYCTDSNGNVHHIAGFQEVEPIEEDKEGVIEDV